MQFLCSARKLLGIPDYRQPYLLSINCQTVNYQHERRQINEWTKQDKSKPKNNCKDNPYTNSKTKQEIDCFIAGLAHRLRTASAETTMKMHNEFSDVFAWIFEYLLLPPRSAPVVASPRLAPPWPTGQRWCEALLGANEACSIFTPGTWYLIKKYT